MSFSCAMRTCLDENRIVINDPKTTSHSTKTHIPLNPFVILTKEQSKTHQVIAENSCTDSTKRGLKRKLEVVDFSLETNLFASKRYRMASKLGEGGNGVVYKGIRKEDNKAIALKLIEKSTVRRWGSINGKKVPLEFELLSIANSAGNKNIIQMIDWYEHSSTFVLVMERPQSAIDLLEYMTLINEPMSEESARTIFHQIVDAVVSCHKQGIAHRDIKCENILINQFTKEAKLIDFGCGEFIQIIPCTQFSGTPFYFPPEWYLYREYKTWKVDNWCLGIVLYAMLESKLPFESEEELLRGTLQFHNVTNSMCRHLLTWMLQKDEDNRPTLQEVLDHKWMNVSKEKMSSQHKKISKNIMFLDLYKLLNV